MLHASFSRFLALAAVAGGASLAMPAAAQYTFEVEGELRVQMELVEACLINSNEPTTGDDELDFGLLDFGQHTSFFSTAAATATGSPGGNLTIKCTPGIEPKLSFDGGENAGQGIGSGARAMTNGTHYVTYNLYNDMNLIPIGTAIDLSDAGTDISFNINGVAYGAEGLIAGIYTDTVTVTLSL